MAQLSSNFFKIKIFNGSVIVTVREIRALLNSLIGVCLAKNFNNFFKIQAFSIKNCKKYAFLVHFV